MIKNIILHPITVVNKHHLPRNKELARNQIYIGRGSALGNQWSHLPNSKATFIVDTRKAAIAAYEPWLKGKMEKADHRDPAILLMQRICRCALTQPTQLVCWCAPQACHGDIIKAFIEKAYAERNN